MSNTRKLRISNPGTSRFARNRREWSGQPGNPTTQKRMLEEQLAAEEASRRPRFVLQPKKDLPEPVVEPMLADAYDSLLDSEESVSE